MTLPERPTRDQLTAYLENEATRQGKIVLVGAPQQVLVTFNPPPLAPRGRRSADPDGRRRLRRARSSNSSHSEQSSHARAEPQPLTNEQIQEQLNQFLVANGALVRINDAGRDHGQIRAFGRQWQRADTDVDLAQAPPTVVMRNEDYGRIWRLLADERAVELEFDIVNRISSGRTHQLQRHRRDSRHRQGRRGRDARRASRFVACRPPAPPTMRSDAP